MRILAVIPARGGSKGVHNKNLRLVGGKPLITYIITNALEAKGIEEVIVSTDSEPIAREAEAHGALIRFMRPGELSGDSVPLVAVSKHALKYYDEHFFRPDAVLSLQPTSPLLSTSSIEKAIITFHSVDSHSVVSVTEIRHFHPFRAYKLKDEMWVSPLTEYTSERFLQKQDRPPAFGFTGGLYLRRRDLLENWSGTDFALGERVAGVVVSEEEALDIDSEVDLMFFDTVLRYRGAKH